MVGPSIAGRTGRLKWLLSLTSTGPFSPRARLHFDRPDVLAEIRERGDGSDGTFMSRFQNNRTNYERWRL